MNAWKLALALAAALAAAAEAAAARTAVVLESAGIRDSHSQFFQMLEQRGHELSFFSSEESVALEAFGVPAFENLVLFSPSKALGSLRKADLLRFVERGGNVLLSASAKLTKVQREFALECGVEFDKKGSLVMDHVRAVADAADIYDSVVAAADFVASERVVGEALASGRDARPVAFSGIGMALDAESILGFHALVAPATAYSANPVKEVASEDAVRFGREIGLVTAVQARNNARVVLSGSLELFSDRFWSDARFSNAELADAVTRWGFQERGVLRMQNVRHHRADGSRPDKMLSDAKRPDQPITLYNEAEVARDSLVYRIKDNLTFSFDLHELRDGEWRPFAADDVQLEFVMLDPHVRKTMAHDGRGHFSVTFEAPDAYGIFLFRVMYRRLGLSTVYSATQVSLRPFKHNEYERFIPAAYPYYASAFSMMAGVFVLSLYFLFHADK